MRSARQEIAKFLPTKEDESSEQRYCIVVTKDGDAYLYELKPGQSPQEGMDGAAEDDDQLIVFYGPKFFPEFHKLLRRTGKEHLGDKFVDLLSRFARALMTAPRESP